MNEMMKQSVFILILSLVVLAACKSGNGRTAADEAGRPLITVTIEPLRYFTEAIAGERFRVVSMVPKGSSPETYDPTPAQLVALAESKAYLRIGHIGFEQTWANRLADNAPHLPFFDTSRGIDLIHEEHTHQHTEEADAHAHHHPGGVEPHVWNSAANARIIAGNVLQALCSIDPAGRETYVARHDSLCRCIARVDSLVRQQLSSPDADRAFLIYHPALSYFAREYGLRQISIEKEGKEPSPARLKQLVDECKAQGIRIIFVQPEFDRRNAELIARQTGTRIVSIHPLSYDWEEEMLNVAAQLGQPSVH